MATITIETVEGQSAYDISLQHYGTIEKIDKVLNSPVIFSLVDTIAPGTIITLEDVDTNSVNEFFSTKRAVSTDNVQGLPLLADEGGPLTGDEGLLLFGD